MSNQLQNGLLIESNGGTIKILDFIGAGGQGEVYRVSLSGKEYALKWYFPHIIEPSLIKSINNLVQKGSPNKRFLWPLLTVDKNGFGYIMDLKPNDYRSLQDYMVRKYDMKISLIAKSCYLIADSYDELHAKGLSYKDISLGNIFINPKNGEILIVDNDNVAVNNEDVGSIIGTPDFLAPELASGKSRKPNSDTDRYSLAILLFHLLLIGHPFDGHLMNKIHCLDPAAKKLLYGDKPVFIFDPNNNSNRPDRTIQKNPYLLWPIYPDYIKSLFIKTFTEGIHDPSKRVREKEWINAFIRFNGVIFECPNCGQSELIYDPSQIKKQGHLNRCRRCNKIPEIARIRVNDYILTCSNGRYIMDLHVNKYSDSRAGIAKFNLVNGELFLTNVSNENIVLKKDNSSEIVLSPNSKKKIESNIEVHIKGTIAQLRM